MIIPRNLLISGMCQSTANAGDSQSLWWTRMEY
jgi:hypothetical protein